MYDTSVNRSFQELAACKLCLGCCVWLLLYLVVGLKFHDLVL